MICPICGCATTVIQTRENSKGEYTRRRECLDCGHRYTTVETVVGMPKEEMNKGEDRKPVMLERKAPAKRVQPFSVSDLYIALRTGKAVAAADGNAGA